MSEVNQTNDDFQKDPSLKAGLEDPSITTETGSLLIAEAIQGLSTEIAQQIKAIDSLTPNQKAELSYPYGTAPAGMPEKNPLAYTLTYYKGGADASGDVWLLPKSINTQIQEGKNTLPHYPLPYEYTASITAIEQGTQKNLTEMPPRQRIVIDATGKVTVEVTTSENLLPFAETPNYYSLKPSSRDIDVIRAACGRLHLSGPWTEKTLNKPLFVTQTDKLLPDGQVQRATTTMLTTPILVEDPSDRTGMRKCDRLSGRAPQSLQIRNAYDLPKETQTEVIALADLPPEALTEIAQCLSDVKEILGILTEGQDPSTPFTVPSGWQDKTVPQPQVRFL